VSLSNFERYQRIAWAYDLLDLPFEYGRYRKIRPMLFRGLSGRILEAGVGTGRNFQRVSGSRGFTGPTLLASTVRPKSTSPRQDCNCASPTLWPMN
jgi:hypothetical protein